jgi:hypothetical protein
MLDLSGISESRCVEQGVEMTLFGIDSSSKLLASCAAAALVAAPVVVLADASAPWVTKAAKAKPKKRMAPKRRMAAKPVARPVEEVKPMMAEPAPQVVEAAPPAEPAPQPVAEAPAAPTPAPPAAPAVVKRGSSKLLLVAGGLAAVAGIVALSDSNGPKSP